MQHPTGKTAVVTGAASGMGLAFTRISQRQHRSQIRHVGSHRMHAAAAASLLVSCSMRTGNGSWG